MRNLKINVSVIDQGTKEELLVTGNLDILRELLGGMKVALPRLNEANDSEAVDVFIEEKCKIKLLDPKTRTQAQQLYDAYAEWCVKTNHRPLSSTKLAREWMRVGFERTVISGLKYWIGVKLTAE